MEPTAATAVAIAAVLIGFAIFVWYSADLELDRSGVQAQADHLLAGARHPDPGFDPTGGHRIVSTT
jgi:hypothetical protein